jgi:hypothetical protein
MPVTYSRADALLFEGQSLTIYRQEAATSVDEVKEIDDKAAAIEARKTGSSTLAATIANRRGDVPLDRQDIGRGGEALRNRRDDAVSWCIIARRGLTGALENRALSERLHG